MNTNLKVKKIIFPIFCNEVWKRLEKGKNKYQLGGNEKKEATDLAEELVPNFQIGDIVKYAAEYLNTKNPQDLFDMAGTCSVKFMVDIEKFPEFADLVKKIEKELKDDLS